MRSVPRVFPKEREVFFFMCAAALPWSSSVTSFQFVDDERNFLCKRIFRWKYALVKVLVFEEDMQTVMVWNGRELQTQ